MAPAATSKTGLGLFAIALATLMFEILLTRIFSVVMWYHFAFMAISVAMFGMAAGAVLVYLAPAFFDAARTRLRLAQFALAFAVAMVLCFLSFLCVPFYPEPTFLGMFSVGLVYSLVAAPFVLSGVCVTLALTRFPDQVGRLYGADLAGAALGCVGVIVVLGFTDGPTSVIYVACIAAFAAAVWAMDADNKRLMVAALALCLGFAGFAGWSSVRYQLQDPVIELQRIKGQAAMTPLFQRWNHFSWIRVKAHPIPWPQAWGLPLEEAQKHATRQLFLDIDGNAGTYLTAFDGDLARHRYLEHDITNLAHFLRTDADVMVFGAGGGRDVLSALVFGQKSVLAVEINQAILEAVTDRFADFVGRLHERDNVTFVHQEARSFAASTDQQFDIVQMTLVDTWAATAAGAFVLSENALYTTEGWILFLERLKERGVLSASRWYVEPRPNEMYRLAAVAVAALRARGIQNPRDHILIARVDGALIHPRGSEVDQRWGVGNLLVSPTPFTPEDVARVTAACAEKGFELVLTPDLSPDPYFGELADAADPAAYTDRQRLNLAAPTDNDPFFFNMLRFGDLFRARPEEHAQDDINLSAVYLLGTILLVVTALSLTCILGPLALTADRTDLRGAGPLLAFFAAIGTGFMLVEISQMQRLVVFLGHPTYGLSVVLFALLLSGGAGSWLTGRITAEDQLAVGTRLLGALLVVLFVFGLVTPAAIQALGGASIGLRIAVAVAILFPLGMLMGTAFPLGLRAASGHSEALTPWLWATNGAMSVLASVLAVMISLFGGISLAFWCGAVAYVGALLAYRRFAR